jgi:hypothetical protein
MTDDLIEKWRELFHRDELPPADEILAPRVAMHSPVMHTPRNGIEAVAPYISGAHKIYKDWDFDYVRGFQSGQEIVMEFIGEVDGVTINGVDMIRWDDDGLIDDFKVMVRPLQGIQMLGKLMSDLVDQKEG